MSNKTQHANRPWRRITSIALLILVAAGIVYALLDIPARIHFSVASAEIEKIQQDVMRPANARLWGNYGTGNGFFDSFNCFPDVHCPRVVREWVIAVPQGQEEDLAKSILQKEGYSVGTSTCPFGTRDYCGIDGTKDKLKVRIDIGAIDQAQQPTEKIAPTQAWRHVIVSVDYLWDT